MITDSDLDRLINATEMDDGRYIGHLEMSDLADALTELRELREWVKETKQKLSEIDL